MNLKEVDKPKVTKLVVIYSGRFQPFHKGHYDAYQRLVSKFGAGNVYIGTSNDQSGSKSPFSFKEKKEIATKMFGIPASRFIQIRNPYQPVEILKKFDGKTTQYIAAVGEKDADRLQGKYFKPYRGKAGYGYDEIGYTYPIPAEVDPISGTDVRNNLGSGNVEKAKKFFLKAYPKFDKEIFKMITGKLNENFIKGYPSKEDVKKIQKKNDAIRAASTTDDSYVYDPIAELIGKVAAEEIFNDFVLEYLGEAPNKALDVDISYTNTKGQQKKIKARDALRLPKDHPAHIQAKKIAGPDDAPISEPKPKEEPGKAAQVAATPSAPGQPTKKGQTAQGQIDKEKPTNTAPAGQEQGPPPEQKLNGAELKSDAETGARDEKAEKVKKALDSARTELSKEDNETIDKVNNPQSPERKGMVNNIKTGLQKFGKGLQSWGKHKGEMVGGTIDAVKALANGQKIGSTKNKETGKWEYSDEKRKEQINHMKHFAIDSAILLGSMALGGAGVAGVKAAIAGKGAAGALSAAGSGATGVFTHGVGGFTAHLGKDIAKHAALETLGLSALSAGGSGATLSTATGGILEIIGEEVDNNNKFLLNFMKKVVEKMEKYQLSDEQLLKSIENYKKNKPKQDAADLLKETLSETKQQSIQHFVEFATKRLKLKETPKITLVGGREFAEVKTSLGGFDPETKEIYVATEGRLTADILRTLAHEMVHRKQDEMGLVKNPMKDGADGSPIENQAHAVAGILMREYGRINKKIYNEGLITEGGAYGHMSHPFDDMDLTFGDLKNIISGALNGELGIVREKTDGQALAISWKKGRLIAARNKSHLANAGANAMGIEAVASKFSGRGGLTDAYNFAMKDLSAAISGLSQKQKEKIFDEGKNFMNIEVIWPQSVNVIPYGQALLVFHNCIQYDESGSAIGQVSGAETLLANMIKQINANIQSKYTIQGPPITSIPKNENLSSKKGKYFSRLQKLQSQFGLSDGDTVSVYHQSWWENFIDTKAPVKVDKLTKQALVRRWAFGDKGFRLNTISNPELQKWAMDNDKVNVPKQQKDNMKSFEEIFLGVGADVLDFVGSVLTVHPEKAIRSIKNRFKSVAADVRGSGDITKIQKLKSELKRLNQLGGIERVVASEGLVFFYNGKTYKLTGTFAPLNQILGLFY
jgi:hypothetical protein